MGLTLTKLGTGNIEVTGGEYPYVIHSSLTVSKFANICSLKNTDSVDVYSFLHTQVDNVDDGTTVYPITNNDELYDALKIVFKNGGGTSIQTLNEVTNSGNITNNKIISQTNSDNDSENTFESKNTARTVTFRVDGNGNVVLNDLTVIGNTSIQGNTIQVDSEISTTDAVILQNDGEVGAGVTLGFSGTEVDRGTENNYFQGFDEVRDAYVIGMITSLIPAQIATCLVLAARADSIADDNLLKWDNTGKKIVDTGVSASYLTRLNAIRTETTNYTALLTDKTIFVNPLDATTSTITLPTTGVINGIEYVIKKNNSTTGIVTVDSETGTVNGAASKSTNIAFQGWVFKLNGSNWEIVGNI